MSIKRICVRTCDDVTQLCLYQVTQSTWSRGFLEFLPHDSFELFEDSEHRTLDLKNTKKLLNFARGDDDKVSKLLKLNQKRRQKCTTNRSVYLVSLGTVSTCLCSLAFR